MDFNQTFQRLARALSPAIVKVVKNPRALNHVWQGLRISLDLLVIVLVVIALVRHPTWSTAVWAIAFAAIYIAGAVGPIGRARISHKELEVAITRPSATVLGWLGLLLAMWFGLALTAKDAAYLAFPLFFVILHVTGGVLSLILVSLTTACAVVAIAFHDSWTFGGVLGPVLGGAVALTVGLGFRMLQEEVVARADALAQLEAARAESEELSRRAGELDERARLAGEIHDTVAQGLSSIQLLLHSAEARLKTMQAELSAHSEQLTRQPAAAPPPPNLRSHSNGEMPEHAREADEVIKTLTFAREVAKENLTETRRIIAALQPAALEGANLTQALRKVCSTTPLGEAIDFEVDGTPCDLPATIEATLVRVTQGAVANVVKHSKATQARVTLTYQPDEVLLDVVDNGIGFDTTMPRPTSSVGISSAERRLDAIDGTMTIESSPGGGCGVSVRIPLTNNFA